MQSAITFQVSIVLFTGDAWCPSLDPVPYILPYSNPDAFDFW